MSFAVSPMWTPSVVPPASSPTPARPRSAGVQPPQQQEPDLTPDPVDLRESFAVLRRNVWLLLAITSICVAWAAYSGFRQKRQFLAQAAVRLADPRRALTNNIAEEADPGYSYSEDRMLSQVQVLTSHSTAERALDREPVPFALEPQGMAASLLRDVTITPQAAADTLRVAFGPESVTVRGAAASATAAYGSPLALPGLRFTVAGPGARPAATIVVHDRDAAVGELAGGVRARQRERSNVIEVSYTGPDPRRAQLAVNAIVHAFAEGDAAGAQGQSQRRRVFIETQLRQNDSLLAVAQQELAAFRARTGTFSAKETFSAEQRDAMSVDVQRDGLLADRALYESLLAGIQQARGSAGADQLRSLAAAPGIASNVVISQLYTQLASYQTRRDSLTTGPWAHAATHPDVQRLDTLIAGTEVKLVSAARSYVGSITTRIQQLDALKARGASAMQRLPAVEAEEMRLNSAVAGLSRNDDQLRAEYQKARISESVQVGQVEIMDLATGPGSPVGSGPVPRVMLGLVVGLFLGGGAAFLKERLDTTVSRRSDLQRYLRVASLGVIPQMRSMARSRGHTRSRGRNGFPASGVLPEIDVPATDAFVTVRTNVAFAHGRAAPGVIAVTSAAPGEGKTTVSSNLARVYAQRGLRVLLVDCDLRRPRVHTIFDVPNAPGLTEVLAGRESFEDAVRSTAVENLFLLSCGSSAPHASDLMAGDAIRELLARQSECYDLVLLDTPPVLAVADGAILGAMTDGVIFVVRAGATEREAALAALAQLASAGAHVTGAVLNDPDGRVPRYSGHYYYAEYYAEQPA